MNDKLLLTVDFGTGKDQLSKSLKTIIGLGKKGKGALRELSGQSRQLSRELGGVRSAIGKASGNVTELVNREKQLERQLLATNRQLQAQKDNLAINAKANRIAQRGSQLRQSGRDNVIQGGAILAPFVLAAKAGAEFEAGMVDIQQKSGLTAAQMRIMRNDILATAKASKQLPESLRAGVDFLAGAGLDATLATKLIGPIGQAATAYRIEVEDLAATSFSNFQNLKVPIDQNAKALNIMVQAGKEGNFEIGDMAQHFPALTAAAQTLGQKGTGAVADLSAALQIARRGAGDSATAATNVQNLLATINTERTIKKFAKFGVDLPAAMKKAAKEGRTPLEEIARLTRETTGGDLSKINLLFGNQQAARALAPLINDFDDFIAIRKRAGGAGDVIDKDFALRAKTGAANMAALKVGISSLALTASQHLAPILTVGIEKLTGMIDAVAAWADRNPKLANSILSVAVGLGILKVGIGAAQLAFGGILGPVSTVFKFFGTKNLAGVSRAAKVFGVLRTAAFFLGKGVMRAGLLMMANPIILAVTLIAVGIGAAALAIYNHWDTIKAAFWGAVAWLGTTWENIKGAFNNGVSFLLGLHGKMLGIGKNIILGIAQGIMNAPGAIWNALKSVVTSGIDGIKAFLGIKSPSRLFMGFGGYMTEGMAIGIDKGRAQPVRAAGRLAASVAGAGALALSPAGATPLQGSNTASVPIKAGGSVFNVTFNIDGLAAKDIDELVRQIIEKIEAMMGVKARREYADG